jgi:hypothetical protein
MEMRSRYGGALALCAMTCIAAGLWAQDAESRLPRVQSRLKPVLVVAAEEVPILEADEPVVVKQAVVIESVAGKSQVVPAGANSPAPEAKLAPVAPSWSLPKPIKKAAIPMTNPYVAPRSSR